MRQPDSMAPEDRKTLNDLPRSTATGSLGESELAETDALGESGGAEVEDRSIFTARSGFQVAKKFVNGCKACFCAEFLPLRQVDL